MQVARKWMRTMMFAKRVRMTIITIPPIPFVLREQSSIAEDTKRKRINANLVMRVSTSSKRILENALLRRMLIIVPSTTLRLTNVLRVMITSFWTLEITSVFRILMESQDASNILPERLAQVVEKICMSKIINVSLPKQRWKDAIRIRKTESV
jgi:hypothetical protein